MNWNFELLLFVLLVVTGAISLLDKVSLRKKRPAEKKMPWWIEYALSFFPVILFVFVLRSFIVEPFRIPSGSMLPTLQSGDFILVNKFSTGIRLPVLDRKIIDTGAIHRGDVIVFRYPVDPSQDYIKRVIGLPGDEVVYMDKLTNGLDIFTDTQIFDKQLYINGKLVPHDRDGNYYEPDRMAYMSQYNEHLDGVDHKILFNENRWSMARPIVTFDGCQYQPEGVRCVVPPGHYFVMGDNRDNSQDSRYWGFVPDNNVVGKAFFIWMNFGSLRRIGRFH